MKNARRSFCRRLSPVPLRLCAFVPLCFFTFVFASPLRAQQATVNTGKTTIDTPIQLTVTLPDGNAEVDTSAIKDFKILSEGNKSYIQTVNGRVISEQTKIYTLLPLREGRLTIPALRVVTDGKTTVTDPIVIQVEKSAANDAGGENIIVSGSLNENQAYQGQQIVYTFRLLYAVTIANADYEAPSFQGFSAAQIGSEKNGQRVIDGRRFNEVTVSYLLIPLKSGSLTIDPAQLQCDVVTTVRRNSRNDFNPFYDSPFFGGTELVSKIYRTKPVTIDILPLPQYTGNEPFSGLVGQFEMKAKLEKDKAGVGESVTLSITIQGNGNLQDADQPSLNIPDVFKQYADQPETDVQLDETGYSGSKVFKTALVPIQEGDYTVSLTPTVYFDPTQKVYRQLAPTPLFLTVTAPESPEETPTVFSALDAGGGSSDLQKLKVDFTGRDILSIKTDLNAVENRTAMATTWFLVFLLAPGLVFASMVFLQRMVKKDQRPAAEMARKSRLALKAASDARGSDDPELLSGLYRALLYAVLSRAGICGESLTAGEVDALLKQSAVPPASAEAVSALFGRLESARFGKSQLSGEEQTSLVTQTRKLVNDLIR